MQDSCTSYTHINVSFYCAVTIYKETYLAIRNMLGQIVPYVRCSLHTPVRGRVTYSAGKHGVFKVVPFKRLFHTSGIRIGRGHCRPFEEKIRRNNLTNLTCR